MAFFAPPTVNTSALAPRPAAANWQTFNPAIGANAVLPAGGTWVYCLFTYLTTTGAWANTSIVGEAAGGTNVATGVANYRYVGFCYKVA